MRNSQKKASVLPVLRRVLLYIRPSLPRMILSLLLALITVGLSLYVPILIGRAVDCIVGAGQVNLNRLTEILLQVLCCICVSALAQWWMSNVNNRITFTTVHDIRRDAFARLQQLPLHVLDKHSVGDTVSRMIADADTFSDGLLLGVTQLFSGVLTVVGTLIFMLTLNPLITLTVAVLTPVSLLVARFIATRTHSLFARQSRLKGEQTALTDEILGEQKLVQAFGHEDASLADFDELNGRLKGCALKATFYSSLTNPCTRFVNALVYAAVALAGGLTVLSGGLTVGGLSVFLSYANQYTKPFNEISGVITELQNALTCAARIFEPMDTPVETEKNDAVLNEPIHGQVRLEDVSFSYEADQKLIEHFNLQVAPGERVAIVGRTGSGKTTLINLLMRFYDPDRGQIRLDGTDTRCVPRHSLRRNIGLVLQDTWLSPGTVRDNIAMGKPDATEEEIVAAAKATHAHSFIRRLPQGYDTVIGEGGGALSQGQKQLLCVTRVMLALPPLLILDEATSSIDTRTEQQIQRAFGKLMQGRTSFIVAHRLSTVRNADIILVMENGKVAESGTHESLLEKNGVYAALYRSQFEH